MNWPEKSSLPLCAEDILLTIDESKLQEFHTAFKDRLRYMPPTLMAMAMKGVFDLINQMQVDWKRLLHATQSFTYVKPIQVPSQVRAKAKLLDLKYRAQTHWLQFEIQVLDENSKDLLVTARTLILVKDSL